MSKTLLTETERSQLLADLPSWKLSEDGAISREFTLPDFAAAMQFVNRVAALAEQANHHPDIDIRYNRVTFALVSHDAGGLTARDASMARQLDSIEPNISSLPAG
jgi:4a-hydroxytetrahydrobiopterin dehydratase